MDAFVSALIGLLGAEHLGFLSLGVLVGLVVGILPGLGGTAGLSLILPFLFGMDPSLALAMMIGVTSVTTTSDTFPSVLMGIPGTASSQATVMDGFPLAKRGEAARALGAAFSASLMGGLFGAVVLTGAVFVAQPVIMAIGFAEQMMLILLALSMVGMLTGASALKGLASCGIGLLLGVIGAAPATGVARLDFGTAYLYEPLPLVVVGLAMFAMPEIVELARRERTVSETGRLGRGWLEGLKDSVRHLGIVLRCSGLGALLGALPGLGGTVIDWIAYSHVMQTSRDRSRFGTGDIRGVIGPESANNAKEGGALVPTLLFGIPGSGSMALLLGGLVLIGLEPGLGMVEQNLDITYMVIWSIAVANVIGAGACLLLAKPVAKLTTVPFAWIAPFMIGIIFFAAYQATRDWGDLIALFVLGMIGIYMKRFGWPRPALLIGFVLSNKVEASIYQTVQVYGFDFIDRPVAVVLLGLTVLSLIMGARLKPKYANPAVHSPNKKMPQLLFWGFILLFALLVLQDSIGDSFLTRIYPQVASIGTIALLLAIGANVMLRQGPHPIFHDSERLSENQGPSGRGNLHYIAWIAALLGAAALFGFVLAVAGFIGSFLRMKAGASVLTCVISVAAFVALLAALAHFLVLDYPAGLLQDWVAMPWPLN